MHELEHFFTCPYCGARISMLLEPLVSSQSYIEDCEICCKPIQLTYQVEDQQVVQFSAVVC